MGVVYVRRDDVISAIRKKEDKLIQDLVPRERDMVMRVINEICTEVRKVAVFSNLSKDMAASSTRKVWAVCIECGKVFASKGLVTCESCLEKSKYYQKRRLEKNGRKNKKL